MSGVKEGFLTSLPPSSCQPVFKHTAFSCGAQSSSTTTVSYSPHFFYSRQHGPLPPLWLLNMGIKFLLLVISYKQLLPEAFCQRESHVEASSPKPTSFVITVKKSETPAKQELDPKPPMWKLACRTNYGHIRCIYKLSAIFEGSFTGFLIWEICMVLQFHWTHHMECSGSGSLYRTSDDWSVWSQWFYILAKRTDGWERSLCVLCVSADTAKAETARSQTQTQTDLAVKKEAD